jgi:hypothetical protein
VEIREGEVLAEREREVDCLEVLCFPLDAKLQTTKRSDLQISGLQKGLSSRYSPSLGRFVEKK